MLGEGMGVHGMLGAAGGLAAARGLRWWHSVQQAGVETANDLERLAMLHPSVARELLARIPPGGGVGHLAMRRIARSLQAVIAGGVLRSTQMSQQQQQQ